MPTVLVAAEPRKESDEDKTDGEDRERQRVLSGGLFQGQIAAAAIQVELQKQLRRSKHCEEDNHRLFVIKREMNCDEAANKIQASVRF